MIGDELEVDVAFGEWRCEGDYWIVLILCVYESDE